MHAYGISRCRDEQFIKGATSLNHQGRRRVTKILRRRARRVEKCQLKDVSTDGSGHA